MPRSEKHLKRMLGSQKCVGFSYEEAAVILRALGFTEDGQSSSHRKWRRLLATGTVVYIGLCDYGHGELKAVYIKDMLKALREHDLIPADLSDD